MKKTKLLAIIVAVVTVMLVFSVSAVAANYTFEIEKFASDSTYKPVDYSTHKSVSTVKLYGNVDYLCMKVYSETNKQETFALEIYSDSARTKKVSSLNLTFEKGTSYEDLIVDLTSFKSGTYYATSYVIKKVLSPYEKYEKDPDTVVNFKISVNRDGTTISNMRSVFIGYENSAAGPVLAWYSVPGAKGYYVYRLENGEYKKIATVNATDEDYAFYVDKVKAGVNGTAYYRVKAYNGSKTTVYSDTLKTYLLKTPTVKAALTSNGKIKVSWSKVTSSCDYVVYRRTESSDWNMIGSSDNGDLYLYDSNVSNNKVYYYTVVAVTDNSMSGYDPIGASVRFIAAPKLKSVKATNNSLTVNWGEVKYAESYNVYRKEADTGWNKIATVAGTETSYADKTAEKNKVYTYTVRAVISGKQGAYSTNGIKGVIFDDVVLNDVEVIDEKSVKITWNDIGDVSYKVYRKSSTDSEWKLLSTVKSAKYTDKEAEYFSTGRTYLYTVKPTVDGLSGEYAKKDTSFIYFSGVKYLEVYGHENSIGIKWMKVENSEGYNIYRKTDGEYELIATVDTNNFLDTTVAGDTKYTYMVTYMFGGNEMTAYSKEINAELLTEKRILSSDRLPRYNGVWSVYIDNADPDAYYTVYKKENGKWVTTDYGGIAPKGNIVLGANIEDGSEYAVTAAYADGGVTNLSNGSFVISCFDAADVVGKVNRSNYSINISWNAVEGAEKYILYKAGAPVAVLDPSVTEYCFENLTPDTAYSFTIGTVKNGVEILGKDYYTVVEKRGTIGSVTLSRSKYVYDGKNKTPKVTVKDTRGKVLTKNVDYKLSVASNRSGIGRYTVKVTCIGDYEGSKNVFFYIKPGKTDSVKSASQTTSSVKLSWSAVPGAAGYTVYRYSPSKKAYVKSGTTEGTSFTVNKLYDGTKYTFKVIAYGKTTAGKVYDSESFTLLATATKTATPAISKLESSSKGKVTLTHTNVSGETGYQAYYSTSKDSGFKKYANFKADTTKCDMKGLTSGKTYYFKVRTYIKTDSGYVYSAWSAVKSVKVK